MRIGFFDSGLGGLTILRAVVHKLPEHDYYYYGDTANLPYGDKTEEEIFEFSKVAMEYLFAQGCRLVIIACNTASAETLRRLQDEYIPVTYPDRRILGVIVPTVEILIESGSRAALLLATRRTVASHKYERELEKHQRSDMLLYPIATPDLVPLIEAGKVREAVVAAQKVIDSVLENHGEINVVVLGCTHYTELTAELRAHYGTRLSFISQDEVLPEKITNYIMRHSELALPGEIGEGKRSIHLTEHRPDYDRTISQLLGGVFVSEE